MIGQNQQNGIICRAPGLFVAGNVYIGVDPEGKDLNNGRRNGEGSGVKLLDGASDAMIGSDSTDAAVVIGWNQYEGILCDAARLTVRGSVFIGVHPLGIDIGNGYGNPGRSGFVLTTGAHDAKIGSSVRTDGIDGDRTVAAAAIVIGNSYRNGIDCHAARLSILGNVFIGTDSDGNDHGNGEHGIRLRPSSSGATIGSSNSSSVVVIGQNKKDGVYSDVPKLVIVGSVFIGVDHNGNDVGNVGHGVHLLGGAANALIGYAADYTTNGKDGYSESGGKSFMNK